MSSRLSELCVDCANPKEVAGFWREVLDWELKEGDGYWYLEQPGSGEPGVNKQPAIVFIEVPEGKTVKNRVHIDVSPHDRDQDEEVRRLEALGARKIDVGQGEVPWVVMADPEDNEFCVLQTRVS